MQRIVVTAAALLLPGFAFADDGLLGVSAGVGLWQQATSGEVRTSLADADLEEDFGIDDADNYVAHVAFEPPLPLVPSFRVQYTQLELSGSGTVVQNVDFAGATFPVATDVTSDADLTHTDATVYWELLDNVVSLDLGVTARVVDGFVEARSATEQGRADFNGVIPMLYGRARVDVPTTGLYASAHAQGLEYDGNRMIDAQAVVGWATPWLFDVEAGYRIFDLQLDDADDFAQADVQIDGFFAGVNVHF